MRNEIAELEVSPNTMRCVLFQFYLSHCLVTHCDLVEVIQLGVS